MHALMIMTCKCGLALAKHKYISNHTLTFDRNRLLFDAEMSYFRQTKSLLCLLRSWLLVSPAMMLTVIPKKSTPQGLKFTGIFRGGRDNLSLLVPADLLTDHQQVILFATWYMKTNKQKTITGENTYKYSDGLCQWLQEKAGCPKILHVQPI